MVDLCIVDRDTFSGLNKPTNELRRHLRIQRRPSTFVYQHQIIDPQFRCNVLTGIAGIGKTSTIENIALSWARDSSYFYDKSFRYVFLFNSRKLNEYRKKSVTFEQLFKSEFNIQLKTLSNVNGNEVLVIIDGIDEIESLLSILETNDVDEIYHLLHELIKDQSSIFPGHTTLLAGRPHVISTLKRFQHHTGPIRIVQIQGFDDRSICTYVQKFCHDNEMMVNRIIGKINGSVTIKAMAAVPQLLSSICSVYSWEVSNLRLEKKTELFVWVFLSLLKHQFPQFSGMLPHQLMSEAAVKKLFSAISKLSYDLILDNRILFEESEIKELGTSDPLLKQLLDAFVLRINTNLASRCHFAHLIVQEFLAAIHCYISGKTISSLLEREFYEIAEFYVGFASADQNSLATDGNVVSLFIRNIPPRFRRSFRQSFTKPKKPSVLSIAADIFSFWERWRLSFETFCCLFYELFKIEDAIPECIAFANHTDIILSGLASFQVVRLNYFLTRLLTPDENNHGPHSLKNVTITIKHSEFSEKSGLGLCLQLLRSFKEVSFINCSFDGNILKNFCIAGIGNGNGSVLEHASFKDCNFTTDNLLLLADCIPLIQEFSLESITLNLTIIEAITQKLLEESHSPHFKLRDLGLRNCSLDDFCIEALCKAFHLIETMDLSDNPINSVRMDMLIRWVEVRKHFDQDKFNLKTLILRNCSSSPAVLKRFKMRLQEKVADTKVDLLF